jgi:hypothetical protein
MKMLESRSSSPFPTMEIWPPPPASTVDPANKWSAVKHSIFGSSSELVDASRHRGEFDGGLKSTQGRG